MLSLAVVTFFPIIVALLLIFAGNLLSRRMVISGIVALLVVLLIALVQYVPGMEESSRSSSVDWVPSLGLNFSLYLDGLSLLFALVIVGIGVVVALYAGFYFEAVHDLYRFYRLLLTFMSAMLGLVLAGNVLTLFIAWELTSVVSFLLISFEGATSPEARKGALQALIVTGGGGLALLLGLVLLGTASGSMEMQHILADNSLRTHAWYPVFTVLILIGCFSKSAQWPLHFWLPGAMSAPTPASAYLHSATMVKAGIYLLLRLHPVLGETPLWQSGLMIFGLITLLVGALLALHQHDLKAALAYSTVSQLGALVALIGLPDGAGVKAALVGILAHSLYKAALFLTAGAVDHATGTRDLTKLGGLAKWLPGWAVVAGLAGLSMAGIPPLLGFVAKETLLDAMLESPLALLVVVVSAALTVAMALILVWDVFMGERHDSTQDVHAPDLGMLVGPAVLVCAALIAGVGVDHLVKPLVQPVLHKEIHLVLFAGFNSAFWFSLLAIGVGIVVFMTRSQWRAFTMPETPSGKQIFEGVVGGVERVGDLVLRSQNGQLRYYLFVILGTVVLLQLSAGLSHITETSFQFAWNDSTDILRGLLLLVSLGAMVASIVIRQHFMAALILGVAGYAVGGLFLLEPAPDVALVQFMVETLGTVLIIIMLAKISAPERQAAMQNLWGQSRSGLIRDGVIAILIGVGVGLFALAAVNHRATLPNTISVWHLENALPLLGFPDVVGAIVTDFRGMDTIIEITVFSVAALGVLTLLSTPDTGSDWPRHFKRLAHGFRSNVLRHELKTSKIHHAHDKAFAEPEIETVFQSHFSTPLTRSVSAIVLPFALLVALSHLLYGGEGPGDGFTAGVISGLGVALWYIVYGYNEAQRRLGWLKPRYLIGTGLTLVIANAALPLLTSQPFLTHISFDAIHLPANLHLSTTLFYETGIFLTVLGCTSTVMEAIAYPGEVEPL